MGISAVLGVLAVTSLLVELTHLRLEVVVGNVKHLVLNLQRKGFVLASHLMITMSEVTATSLHTRALLHVMSAERSLVEHVKPAG